MVDGPSLSVEVLRSPDEFSGGCRWPDWNGSDSEETDPDSDADIIDPSKVLEGKRR